MKFDIARQSLLPAFLTLIVLALVWANRYVAPEVTEEETIFTRAEDINNPLTYNELANTPAPDLQPEIVPRDTLPSNSKTETADSVTLQTSEKTTAPTAEQIPEEATSKQAKEQAEVQATAHTALRMALQMPATAANRFMTTHPLWGKSLAVLLIIITGLTIGRIALRYNLYSVNSALPIPLSFMLALAVGGSAIHLSTLVSLMTFALMIKNYSRSFRSGYTFDACFRGGMYLGLMVLFSPAALLIILLFPLALFFFHRTLREAVVSMVGLLTAPLALGYTNWAMRGDFTAPFLRIGEQLMAGEFASLFTSFRIPSTPILIGVGILTLLGIFSLMANIYSVGTKPRFILLYAVSAIITTALLPITPAVTEAELSFVALPAALIITGLMIRLSRIVSSAIYLTLIAVTLLSIFLA